MTDPIQKLKEITFDLSNSSELKIPLACCLSTIGLDGFPNARFVALKDIDKGKLILTGPFSTKFKEINSNNKVALTFWFQEIELQVRIQGEAIFLNKEKADGYFDSRDHESKIATLISDQSKEVNNYKILEDKFLQTLELYKNKPVQAPENWTGIMIDPVRIEFLEFKTNRLHERRLHIKKGDEWEQTFLQP